jgi:hypothetical protein
MTVFEPRLDQARSRAVQAGRVPTYHPRMGAKL